MGRMYVQSHIHTSDKLSTIIYDNYASVGNLNLLDASTTLDVAPTGKVFPDMTGKIKKEGNLGITSATGCFCSPAGSSPSSDIESQGFASAEGKGRL